MSNQNINRRQALKRLAVLTGGALSMSTITGVMSGCRARTGSFTPKTLNAKQNEMVTVISELIIPETDTPGARAAGVNQFVDKMLTDWNYEDERKHFLSGLDHVDEVSNSNFKKSFLDLNNDQQVEVLTQLEDEAREADVPDSDLKPFFSMMKEYTVVGYYTSEIGANQELHINIVPGYYDGCVPYSEIGKAWA